MEHLVWIIPVGLVVVVVLWWVATDNGLVGKRNEVKNSWSQIDVQLKRRYDLIPNLVETAKGYMKHERETLEAVIKARQTCVDLKDAGKIGELMKAEGGLTASLGRLMMVAENYPDLKANENMLKVQEVLTSTENRIAFARQHYNDTVRRYNTKLEQIPTNIVKNFGDFPPREYFELEDPAQREAPQVKF